MDKEQYMKKAPFEVSQEEKDAFFREQMKSLTEHHRKSCRAYDDICNGLNQPEPFIPVALFKDLELASVEQDQIARQITSSGTTGQKVSRIFLDAETSDQQRRALCHITGDFIGTDRIPMLIIDAPDVLRDRRKFTARGAGILGFATMSSRRYYAFDENMELDWESIETFSQLAKEGPTFAFGFTFMIWAYFYKALIQSGRKPDLSGCYLIHGGGWKKLQDQKVSDEEFKNGLKEACGITKVSDYYGMAEQTGSIFMQCECGHLHASMYSDIEILNPADFSPCKTGEWGLIALKSFLPKSYPGHKLLTEDWGRILGEDDCPCGRKGKYFEIQGRISKAEIRGCSDTFEDRTGDRAKASEEDADSLRILAGEYPLGPAAAEKEQSIPSRKAFDPLVMEYLSDLSALFTKDPNYRQYPDVYALGFWCRSAHLQQLEERQKNAWENAEPDQFDAEPAQGDAVSSRDGKVRKGKGLVLHIAPSNMPTMFAYSWITALLAGCSNIVRLSHKESEISQVILQGIRQVLDQEKYRELKQANAFVQFARDHKALQEISMKAAARIVWGGDETVEHICSTPKAEDAIDIAFPDKYSIALLDASYIKSMDDDELRHTAHLFYRDTYGADQNACSSPKTVFWLTAGTGERELADVKERWWNALAKETERYDLQPWMATEKYRQLCVMYATHSFLRPLHRWGNEIYVVPWNLNEMKNMDVRLWQLAGNMGLFYEADIASLEEMYPYLDSKIQTVVAAGNMGTTEIYEAIRSAGCCGVDRVVQPGEALEFDTIWDRKDMIDLITQD